MMRKVTTVVTVMTVLLANSVVAQEAEKLLKRSGVHGGLVVHLGCDDADFISRLRAGNPFLVHGLDTAPERIETARRHLDERGLYGPVSVDVFDGRHLPYVANLVNLLIISDDTLQIPAEEIERVLAPRGVALVRSALDTRPENLDQEAADLTDWTLYRKRVPEQIDDWGHYLHGAENNALSHDTVVGPPRHMQWLAEPRRTRHHDTDKGTYPTVRAVVSARGRLYYLLDETPSSNMRIPSRWMLIARDGFSGVQLWKKPVQAETYGRELEQVWRQIIADGDRVYAQLAGGAGLSQLDGATGELLRTYVETEGFREVIKRGGNLLFVGPENHLMAVDAESGRQRWTWRPGDDAEIIRLTLAAADDRVFVKTTEAVCSLAIDTGAEVWTHLLPKAEKPVRLRWPRERLIVAGGVVLVSFGGKDPTELNRDTPEFLGSHPRVRQYGGRLAALDATTGEKLWETAYMPNLESAPGEIYVHDGVVWLGPDYAEARDLRSGEPRDALGGVLEELWTDGHHYRCYPGKATARYILTAKRGIEFFDISGEKHSRNNWVRSTCRVGVTPCNGLLYASPHSCGCYMEAMINGFWALAAEDSRSGHTEDTLATRLEPGPAYGTRRRTSANAASAEWPTYRGNNARSGSTAVTVPARLQEAWSVDLSGKLSGITVADGKLFVAQVDQHTVHALDAASGRRIWQYTAGGRVDSPPTWHKGLLLFGSRDGFVYCLRADDGRLVWRFQAAPRRLRAVALEQLESPWPVSGSVLVERDVAYVSAGRSSNLDGGIHLYALHPATGEVLRRRKLASQPVGAMEPPKGAARHKSRNKQNWSDYKTHLAADKADSFAMDGALTDVMSSDGDSIFMRHLRFDRALARRPEKRQHLFSTSHLLDDTEHHRSYWVLGSGDFRGLPVAFPWIVGNSLQVPFGLTMAFDENTVWSVRGGAGRKRQTPDYRVVSAPRPDPTSRESAFPDFKERSSDGGIAGARRGIRPGRAQGASHSDSWQTPLTARPRAIVRAGDHLVIGGMQSADYNQALDDWTAGNVRVLSSADGVHVNNIPLEAPPIWDGMAAANGKLYVSLENGKVTCLAE
jgi:outer membrane protein assembly factor BamB